MLSRPNFFSLSSPSLNLRLKDCLSTETIAELAPLWTQRGLSLLSHPESRIRLESGLFLAMLCKTTGPSKALFEESIRLPLLTMLRTSLVRESTESTKGISSDLPPQHSTENHNKLPPELTFCYSPPSNTVVLCLCDPCPFHVFC